MKYFFSLVITIFLINFKLHAQTHPGYRLEFGVNGGRATTNPGAGVAGFDIRLEKSFSNRLSGTLTAGYLENFNNGPLLQNDHYIYTGYTDVIPVKAGLKYFVKDDIYVGGEAGLGIGLAHGTNSFLYSPSIGYAFRNGLDLSARYEGYSRNTIASNLSFRLAYGIDLDKRYARQQTTRTDCWQMGFGLISGTTNSHDAVLGGEVEIFRPLSSNLEATASLGAFHIFDAYRSDITNSQTTPGRTVIPAMAGLRLFAGNKFYFAGETGAAFDTHGKTEFAYSSSAGLAFRSGLDLSLKYSGFNHNQIQDFMALKIGYDFKL